VAADLIPALSVVYVQKCNSEINNQLLINLCRHVCQIIAERLFLTGCVYI